MEIAEVGGERELHCLVRPEQLVEHLGDAGAPLAQQRPQAPYRFRRMAQPIPGIVLVAGCQRHCLARGNQPVKVLGQSPRLMGKARGGGLKRPLQSARQGKRGADLAAAHFVQVADLENARSLSSPSVRRTGSLGSSLSSPSISWSEPSIASGP